MPIRKVPFATEEFYHVTPETGTPGNQNNFGGPNSEDRDSGEPKILHESLTNPAESIRFCGIL